MTRNDKAKIIKQRVKITDLYKPQRAKTTGLVCPFCKSGENGDGAFTIYEETNTFHCYSCDAGSSVIDLYMQLHNVTFEKAVDELWKEDSSMEDLTKELETAETKEAKIKLVKPAPAQEKDFSSYYEKCQDKLFAADNSGQAGWKYLEEERCLDVIIAGEHRVGFDPKSDPVNSGYVEPRIILPTSNSHYVARSILKNSKYPKLNPKGAKVGFFNIETLKKQETQEVFICEGIFDALSFLTVGAEAIALNSTTMINRFVKVLEEDRPRQDITFIIAMDNDEPGKKAGRELASALRALGLSFIMGNVYGDAKDANEALCKDREAFTAAVKQAKEKSVARPDNVSTYIDEFMGADIEHFNVEHKTGFPSFDEQTGGLYPGLYVLAAISSLGKTSFALQLADQLAGMGEDVLFFSLEMSTLELVSKSIARTISKEYPDKLVSSIQIRKGQIPEEVRPAVAKYKSTVGNRLSIIEGNFEVNVSSIGDYIRKYIIKTGTRPVVILDYLQILQPKEEDAKKGKREAIDNTVTELKRLSRELDAPFIVISSINRTNYQAPVDFESLKESGNIEYSADVVLGLQLQCLREQIFAGEKNVLEKRRRIKEAKKETPRKIELVCLKNRYGISSFSCNYDYYPAQDLFEEMGETSEEDIPL